MRKKIILFCCLLLLFTTTGYTIQNNKNISPKTYDYFSITSNNISDLSFLDQRLDNAEIILIGEAHGIKCNTDIELKFLKYLVKNHGIKYYLCELPHSVCIKMNEFLRSGNIDILNNFFNSAKGTNTYTNESYQKWIDIYNFNQTLADDDKITVVGVECELIPEYALSVIYDLLSITEVPNEIEHTVNLLKTTSLTSETINNILFEIETNSIYKEYWNEDIYFNVHHILKNILIANSVHEQSTSTNRYKIRDQAMYDNFILVNSRNKEGKYFGQFGMDHTFQSENNGVKWFASLLKNNGYNDKIVSIPIEYKNCHRNYFDHDGVAHIDDSFEVAPMANVPSEIIDQLSKETAVIYSALDETSPYHDLKEYLQYVIIVKDSDSQIPFCE